MAVEVHGGSLVNRELKGNDREEALDHAKSLQN